MRDSMRGFHRSQIRCSRGTSPKWNCTIKDAANRHLRRDGRKQAKRRQGPFQLRFKVNACEPLVEKTREGLFLLDNVGRGWGTVRQIRAEEAKRSECEKRCCGIKIFKLREKTAGISRGRARS